MKKFLGPRKKKKFPFLISVLILAVLCVGGVELLVCSYQDPTLYARITAPVRAAVTGDYGRYGGMALTTGDAAFADPLARRLLALGAQVTIAARKHADLAWASSEGFSALPFDQIAGEIATYDLVCNTVPAVVLDEATLRRMNPKSLLIDLASKPGGVDFSAAADLGVKVIWALSLPGKTAPVSAGLAVQSTIYNILTELGV